MKIRLDRKDLVSNLAWCLQSVPPRPADPIMACVQITPADDHIVLRTTDLETFHTAKVKATTDGTDEAVVSAKRLHDIVAASTAPDLDLVLDNGIVTVTAGRSNYKFRTMPAGNFPRPVEQVPGGATIKADILRHLVATTAAAVLRGTDIALPILYGINLTGDGTDLVACATDRFKATIATAGYNGDALAVTVGHRELTGAAKAFEGDVTLGHNESLLQLSDGTRTATLRLMGGDFPPMASLFKDPSAATNTISIHTEDTIAALQRLALMVEPKKPVTLSADGTDVMLATDEGDDNGSGDEYLDATATEAGDIKVAPAMLAALLAACPPGPVDLHLFGKGRPMLIDPTGRQQHLLMPVRTH